MDFSTLDLAGSPGPRGLVLAHPFEGKYYDYRDPRVSPKPYNLNWTLPHSGPPICWATLAPDALCNNIWLWKNILLLLGGDISQRDKNGCKCQTTKGQIS